jgi:hypothetical protein
MMLTGRIRKQINRPISSYPDLKVPQEDGTSVGAPRGGFIPLNPRGITVRPGERSPIPPLFAPTMTLIRLLPDRKPNPSWRPLQLRSTKSFAAGLAGPNSDSEIFREALLQPALNYSYLKLGRTSSEQLPPPPVYASLTTMHMR